MVTFGDDTPEARAHEALKKGDFVRALALIDQLVADRPSDPVYRCWHSYALLGVKNPTEALAAARQAVALGPRLFQSYLTLAWSAIELGRKQEAQDAFEMALTLSDRDPFVLVEYATFLSTERGPAVAEKVAREAVAAQPNSPEAWRALGFSLFRLHQHAEAEACLERSLALGPDDPATLVCMIELLNRTGQPERATELTDVLRRDPETAEIAKELRGEAAVKSRALGRAGPRLQRFLSPVDEDRRLRRESLRRCVRAVLWALAIGAILLGVGDALARGRILPYGIGPLAVLLGMFLLGGLWYSRY
jgi:Tfp pilus assembly protein PilF